MKSELRKKDAQLEESRDENRRLASAAGRSRDGSPGFAGGSSRGDSPSSSESSAGSELDRREAGSLGGSDDEKDALRAALAENASLKKFLRDYGMTWVGDGDARASVSTRGAEEGGDERSRRDKKVTSSRLKARAEAARANKPVQTASVPEPGGTDASAPTTRKDGGSAGGSAGGAPGVRETRARAGEMPSSSFDPGEEVPPPPRDPSFSVDVEKLLASIAELNAVAGDGKSSVVVGPNGERRLETPSAKTLTLFADGFVVDDDVSAFRAFADGKNRSYIRDLLDGFFPYEYKEAHPNGVPFKLVDKSSELGAPAGRAFVAFTGGRARLDGKDGARDANATGVAATAETTRKQTEENKDAAFLERLPRVVVRDGAVVRVRESVGAAMAVPGGARTSKTQTVLETTVARGCFRSLLEREGRSAEGDADASRAERASSPSSLSTLRVKGMDGQKMYIVKLAADDTVGKLRRYLRSAVAGDDDAPSGGFEIRNAYPPRTFADDAATLRDAGLVPNATLLLRPA